MSTARILVAGVGNIFLGDDAFGVEVARRLSLQRLPEGVRVQDFGIRSLHLAFDLLDGQYDVLILVDALPRRGRPGTLYVLEPDLSHDTTGTADPHSIDPTAVFAALRALGGTPGRVLIVGCEAVSVEEGIGLSAQVEQAVSEAVTLVGEIVAREREKGGGDVPGNTRPDRATSAR